MSATKILGLAAVASAVLFSAAPSFAYDRDYDRDFKRTTTSNQASSPRNHGTTTQVVVVPRPPVVAPALVRTVTKVIVVGRGHYDDEHMNRGKRWNRWFHGRHNRHGHW